MTDRSPLDGALRQAARDLTTGGRHPDESAILAYLAGTANELQIREVREALASSPDLRRDVADFARTMDLLDGPEAADRYDRADVPPPPAYKTVRSADPGIGWRERLGALVRMPAFAVAFALALVAYPAYRALVPGRGVGPAGEPVRESVALFLREDRVGSLRGDATERALPTVTLPAGRGRLLSLTLEAPSGPGPWNAVLRSDDRELWRGREPLSAFPANGDRVVTLLIDPAPIPRGTLTVILRSAAEPDAEPALYRFVLAAEER